MSSQPEINLTLSLNPPATQNPDEGKNLDLNLNLPVIPPDEGSSSSSNLSMTQAIPVTQSPVPQMAPIIIDSSGSSSDDDVSLSSPRSFAEARDKARRIRGGVTIGVNAEKQAAPESLPKQPTVTCPICLDTVAVETATKCGHIFCRACIRKAVKKKKKCPSCRETLGLRDLRRIFFPTNNNT